MSIDKKIDSFELDIPKFSQRYLKLISDTSKKKVVYIKNEFDNSTFRYRYYNFNEALKDSKKYIVICFLCSEIPFLIKVLNKISLIVFQRTTWDNNTQNLINLSKNYNIPIAYDVDDLIYKADYIPNYLNNVGVDDTVDNVRLFMGIATAHEMVAKQCNYFITTVVFLKKQLEKDFDVRSCYVVPNFLNEEQLKESKFVLTKGVKRNNRFYIGYFSGSPSHLNDFRVCKKELIQFLNKYDNVYLKIVGYMNLDSDFDNLIDKGRIIFKPLCSYKKLQREIGNVDLNIVPLSDIPFNYAKSELKYFESAVVKVPSIVSNVGIYRDIIKNQYNGIIVNQGQWFNALEKIYSDTKFRDSIANNAFNDVKEKYNYKNYCGIIEDIYNDILDSNHI